MSLFCAKLLSVGKISLTARDWIRIFNEIGDAVESAKDRLNQLDGEIGDGDHGVSMSIGFRATRAALETLGEEQDVGRIFTMAGQAFLSAAGGAIGPLVGTMWLDTGKALAGSERFGAAECRQMLEAMEGAVMRRGKARPGEKTLLDALHPAVLAAREVKDMDLLALLAKAAQAADAGAQNTVSMLARVGRASRLGNRTIGHQDAGATSMALMLAVICEAVQKISQAGVEAQ